jgi:hypothetical protein
MKQFASWFTHGVRNGAELRRQVQSARQTGEVLERVEAFFECLSAEDRSSGFVTQTLPRLAPRRG